MTHTDKLALIASKIRNVPDFPKPGILFKDITPLLGDGAAFATTIELLAERVSAMKPQLVVGIESRGFILGAPIAARLGLGFVPVRKPGKLPYKRIVETYQLEYGSDSLELHEDAVQGRSVVIVDDLLATGGTAAATSRLCARAGGRVVGIAFAIELGFLGGRDRLGAVPVEALLGFD